jgi:hypothetical protein
LPVLKRQSEPRESAARFVSGVRVGLVVRREDIDFLTQSLDMQLTPPI